MSASLVMMVEPVAFSKNKETAKTNAFQKDSVLTSSEIQAQALNEFKGVVAMLRDNGICVQVHKDIEADQTPDSIFPNNWVSFHADGRVVLYPMCTENRRRERRLSFILETVDQHKLNLDHIVDFSFEEQYGKYLEGTGSIVFDHQYKLAYACHSERMHEEVLQKLCKLLGYQPVTFSAVDQQSQPIYHTNVMMAVAQNFVVICLESISDLEEREKVRETIIQSGKDLVEISYDQMNHFCGNVLELFDVQGESILAMSSCAFEHFTSEQKAQMNQYSKLVHAPIPTIEHCGGGSVRCMICEVVAS